MYSCDFIGERMITCPNCGSKNIVVTYDVVCKDCGFVIFENIPALDLEHNITNLKDQHQFRELMMIAKKKDLANIAAKVIQMYKEGKPIKEIMEECGIYSCKTIYSILRGSIKLRKNKSPHRKVNEKKIIEMYKEGKSIYAIAKELGLSTSRVYYILKKHGLK